MISVSTVAMFALVQKFSRTFVVALIALCVSLFSGCSSLEKLLNSSDASLENVETPEQKAARLEAERQASLQADFQSAVAFHRAGDIRNARRMYEQLTEQAPERATPWYNLAKIYFSESDLDTALLYLDKALDLDESFSDALLLKGLIAREQGQFDQAEANYRLVLEGDSEHVGATLNLAILLDLYRGRHAQALILYQKYEALTAGRDARVKDWIFDLNERLKAVAQ